jgi:hypothetical protein
MSREKLQFSGFKGTLRLLLGLFLVSAVQAGPVYDSIKQGLSSHDHRLPGSESYKASADLIEQTLTAAGVEIHRQTFDTLVPETRECRVRVGGTEVAPIYALGPNGPANNTTAGKTLTGPLVYLGQGTLAEMKGKPVDGCIAVVDFDSPNMLQVFGQGALAVIFVGDGTETQWQVRNKFIKQAASLPRLFVARDDAERLGLLENVAGRIADVTITTTWKDVVGINLWAEIPGEPGATFKFDEEEAIVLAATYDTFGVVPELSPSDRLAANCALLAEVATELQNMQLKRSVFVVFLGSHYAAQDGARMFYFAVKRGKTGELAERLDEYNKMLEESETRMEILASEDFFNQDSPLLRELITRVEKRLNARVSTLNYDLQKVREALLPLKRLKTVLPAQKTEIDSLLAEEARIQALRGDLNNMRRQFNDREITNQVLFVDIANDEIATVKREMTDVRNLIAHNETHQELADRLSAKRIMGHFDIDFADVESDWTVNIESIGSQMFYHSMNMKWAEMKLGDYVKNIVSLAEMDASLNGNGAPGDGLFIEPVTALMAPRKFCVPSVRSRPARVAHAMQAYGYQLVNVGNPLNGDELPYRESIDLSALSPRLAAFMGVLATDPAMSQVCPLEAPKTHKDAVMHFKGEGGLRFLQFARGSATELAGVPEDGIAYVKPNKTEDSPVIAGHSYSASSRIRASGHIFIPLLYNHVKFMPFGYEEEGRMTRFPRGQGWADPRLFYGEGGLLNTPLSPGGFTTKLETLASGETDEMLQGFRQLGNGFFTFYTDEEDYFKVYAKSGLLLLGSTEDKPRGSGLPLHEQPLYSINTLRQTAHDYLMLNESRLQILRDKNIVNDSLESLHADAEEHWESAKSARDELDTPVAVAHEAFSAWISSRVAPALREVTNDMVRAVVLLLLLTLPFAFIMERLFISATSIYRQVLGFIGFFLGTFVLLYFVHPAFQIATSPLIIFLAFVIILLSGMVISIVMSKFKKELRAMQGLSTSAHGVASDSSTGLAAVLIGISGMRNRPLKTFLTGLTIILLTFAIVVFASFSPATGVVEEYAGKGDGPSRIELHRFSGLEMPSMLYETMAALYADEWNVFAREAFFRGPKNIKQGDLLVAYNTSNKKWERLQGMVGFDPAELGHNESLAKALPGLTDYKGTLPPILLSDRTAQSMELNPGDTVRIDGKAFAYVGAMDTVALDQMEYLDHSKIMPPDFESSINEMMTDAGSDQSGGDQLTDDAMVDTTRFTYCSARNVGVTITGVLHELDDQDQPARMNAIMMYAGDGAAVDEAAESIAQMFVGPVMAKSADGAKEYFFSTSLQATGLSVVIVPLLLGGLIIFNSLLGSIVEREKEIFTYSAMGLSPPSVGALFFAESGVYAIMGCMGGYMVSQVVAKLVSFGGEMGWFVPPEMNFSSLSSVLTSFVVMAMVMISTIYPAIKAGRSANPGVARKWKMPAPKDGCIDFVFPFTVSAEDMGGILAFIGEHFENHGDSSIGSFAASSVELFRVDDNGNLGIRAEVSLAPFDLGVMQAFTMSARPSEIEGIDEIFVQLHKVSGTEGAWLRGNRVFVNDLREQFLLWRSLPVSTVMHYREESERIAKS